MTETRLPTHAYAELFPQMSSPEFDRLVGQIATIGLQEEIVLYDGKILDGQHRYLACLATKVTPRFREYAGECGSPLAFVLAKNFYRRHLTDSQRAMLAAKLKPQFEEEARQRQLASLKHVKPPIVPANLQERSKQGENGTTAQKAAQLLKVSERSVNAADKVKKEGTPELTEAVAAGKVSVSAAARIATLAAEQQQQVLAGIGNGLKPKQALAQVQAMPQTNEAPLVDDQGQPLPDQAIAAFQQRKELRALCRRLDAVYREFKRLSQSPIGVHFEAEPVRSCLDDIKRRLSSFQPAHVCPHCRASQRGCDVCRGHGWVTSAIYENGPAGGQLQ